MNIFQNVQWPGLDNQIASTLFVIATPDVWGIKIGVTRVFYRSGVGIRPRRNVAGENKNADASHLYLAIDWLPAP